MSTELTLANTRDLAVKDAVRLLCYTALNDGSLRAGAQEFVAQNPRGIHAPLLRQALADGELLTKAIAPATTTDIPNAGALMPPALLTPLTRRLQEASVLGKIAVPVPPGVPIPYETAPQALQWIPENGPTPVSPLALASVTAKLFKFGGILLETVDLARATAGGSSRVIDTRLVNASTRFLDRQLFDPAIAAVANKNPASLTNGVTPTTAGATIDDTVSALVAAFYAARPDALTPTFVASPATATKLAHTNKTVRADTGGTLDGVPVVISGGALSNLILLDASAIYGHDAGADIVTSSEAAIEAEASPANPVTAGTVIISLWTYNLIGFRLARYCGWAKAPNAVAYAVIP